MSGRTDNPVGFTLLGAEALEVLYDLGILALEP